MTRGEALSGPLRQVKEGMRRDPQPFPRLIGALNPPPQEDLTRSVRCGRKVHYDTIVLGALGAVALTIENGTEKG